MSKYTDIYGVTKRPNHEITRKLAKRIEDVAGYSLISLVQYQDTKDYASVTARISIYCPFFGQFALGPKNNDIGLEFIISTDGFGILVQQTGDGKITALNDFANFVMARLNNPHWKEYKLHNTQGHTVPI